MLNKCQAAKDWINRDDQSMYQNWINRVNKNLSHLNEDQLNLLRNKFENIKNINQLIDKLAEILVAAEYGSDKPVFLSDKNSGPDIFLEKTKKYIEVKNLNNSDVKKNLIKKMREQGGILEGSSAGSFEFFLENDEENYKRLISKAKEMINKGIKQLDGKDGSIYFVYSIDLIPPPIKNIKTKSECFENDIKSYCQKNNIDVITKSLSRFF